jgi:hypothetical protein
MAVSDSYIVQYLIQTTLAPDAVSVWTESDGGFRTTVRNVDVELDIVPSRAGERIFLTFTCEGQRACIAEPPDLGFLHHKYENEEKRHLSVQMRDLAHGVARKCADRRVEALERPDETREWVFHRLLFDEEDPAGEVQTTHAGEVRMA